MDETGRGAQGWDEHSGGLAQFDGLGSAWGRGCEVDMRWGQAGYTMKNKGEIYDVPK